MKITGNTLSVVRAGITCIIYLISDILHTKADVKTTIAIASLITIINNPFNLFNVGMQLSYAGTISIILFYSVLEKNIKIKFKILKYVVESIILTFSANIFIIPIMIYHFNTISLTFLFSNLCASPLIGIATILGTAVSIVSFISIKIARILAILLNADLIIVIHIANFFAKFKISKLMVITPNLIYIIIFYIVVTLVLYLKKLSIKFKKYILKIGIIIIVVIISFNLSLSILNKNKLEMHFIDVGQGDSCLIETPNGIKILIDGGGSLTPELFDVGKKTLLPYLLDRKITRIDYIMVSHFDEDHCQGLESVIDNIKVKNIILSKQYTISNEYKKIINMCKSKNIKIIIVKEGERICFEKNVYADILNPANKLLDDSKGGLNSNAIVAKFYYKLNKKYFTMLFTGDIEEKTENELVNKYKENLKADLLKVAHHGSKTSSTQEFLNEVQPKICLIGVGKNNKFGHPNIEVIERLKNIGSNVYRTDINGEISIEIYRNGRLKIEKSIN